MSAISTEYPNVVRKIITNVNVTSHTVADGGCLCVRALLRRKFWDTVSQRFFCGENYGRKKQFRKKRAAFDGDCRYGGFPVAGGTV